MGEYRVTTSSASADAGRGAGAQVSVVYRSGTNKFHGSVYEFNRNTVYNANNFFANRGGNDRPVFLRNQYGASFGGPLRKNKTFFFMTWEGQREIQASIENRLTYSQALRDGTFRYNPARSNSSADVDANGNPVVPYKTIDIYTVDPTRLGFDPSGIVASKLKQIPLPNNYDIGDGMNLGGNRYLSSNPNHGNQFVVKIDHTLTQQHQLTGSIGGSWYYPTDGRMFTGYQQNEWSKENRMAFIGFISSLRPNLTNELRMGATRKRIQRELIKDWTVQAAYVGNIAVGGWRAINFNQIEIRSNGFLEGFQAAQRNLAANGNPNKGEPIGLLGQVFAPLGGIPSSQNTTIAQGQAATLADFADTTTQGTGVRGGLITAAGLPVNLFRLNPQVSNANIGDNLSVSTWHALKVEVGKRFSGGTYFQFNYTLAKGLTDYVGGQSVYDDFRDNQNRRLDKSLQNYDATHVIQANGIWELPFGANKRWLSGITGWKSVIISGWQFNGIFQLTTSRPFTISSGRNNLTTGDSSTADYAGKDFNIGAKVVKGDLIYSITREEQALFRTPPAGSPGGTPQRAFRGPMYTTVDVSMFKNFYPGFLGEAGIIQFRAEAFNVFNHTNFGLPASNITAGNFGQIGSAYSPRILQFALRLAF